MDKPGTYVVAKERKEKDLGRKLVLSTKKEVTEGGNVIISLL